MSRGRRRQLVARLHEEGLAVLLVSGRADVRYLSGFTGSNGWLLVSESDSVLITDARYAEQAPSEASGCRVEIVKEGLVAGVAREITALSGSPGLDPLQLSHAAALELMTAIEPRTWRRVPGLVAALRLRKEPGEIARIRGALSLAEEALSATLRELHAGMTELEVAARIEYAARSSGAEGMAFDTIVAAGVRAASPHARPSAAVIGVGEVVVIDMGCVLEGYCSDITRLAVLGPAMKPPWDEVVPALQEALAEGIAAIAPGVAARDVDRCARGALDRHGLGRFFTHGLGHGVGLQVHEGPPLSARSDAVLDTGMIVTVEPGVYMPGRGGARLEEMILVTDAGHERLNRLPTSPWLLRSGAE